ncbi:MAG: peptidoglycan-associated lipoprotein Pal [Gammaproteobacteria bacterium]|nr:MAG: peptidoglycan-associated lipoprotein Pal [Gammaproteobacteria bacterium]UCH40189.1 MAG: peptidoglycan-associated lipoprotein Pal [Gammaproteobacteria bacterium]
MKRNEMFKSWLLAGLLALFITACATTQEEITEDGPPPEDETQMGTGVVTDDGTGVDATGVAGVDDAGTTAITDEGPMTALEMLEQTEGALSNRTIYFEFDSAKLTSESIEILEVHGNFIAGNGEVSVRLEGHADERGSREYNIALGDRRAQSVRRVLLFQGASTDQVDTVSYGEEQPAMQGHNEEAWAKNRRVELIYTVN